MPRYRVTVSSPSGEAMVDLVRVHKILVSDHGARHNDDVGFVVYAAATDAEIELLRAHGYVVEMRSEVSQPG